MKFIKYSDPEARLKIAQDINTNLFVEASAGSGKTTSLVNRMVALVEHGVPVNEICTITFTIAAADEFFERFQKLLSKRTTDDLANEDLGPTSEKSKKYCQEALKNIDSCFTGTMDSFCNMVAHELPNELDIPSDAEIISDEEKISIIKEEYNRILSNPSHPLYELAGLFNRTIKNPFDGFVLGMNKVSDYRDYNIKYDKDLLDSSADNILDNEIDTLVDLLKLIKEDGLNWFNSASAKKSTSEAIDAVWKIKHKNWKEHVKDLIYYVKKIDRETKYKPDVVGTTLETKYLTQDGKYYVYDQDIKDKLNRIEEVANEYSFQVYFSFIDLARKEAVEKMKKDAKFTFFDFLYYLTKKFKESSATEARELVSHVFSRHSRILIDESQDTSPMQTQLFFYLTGTIASDDWEKVSPAPGSIFIVGDPKQSIYGFRGADVNAYNHSREVFKNIGEVINLTKNFRSNVILKEYFNTVMNNVLSIGDNPLTHPDIPLTPSNDKEKARYALEQSKEITLNGEYKYLTTNNNKIDPVKVVELIKKIVNNDNYKIISKSSNEIRKIEYKDILVITRGTSIYPYIAEFARNKIPLRVEAKIYFSNSPSVFILKKLLYLLFEPYKRNYFVDVVKSDLYKLNDQDIITMLKNGFSLDISNLLNKDGNPVAFSNSKHESIIKELNSLYEKTKGLSASSTLFYLLSNNDFDFFRNISSDFLDYAYYMIELVKTGEKDGSIVSFEDAHKFLENFINDDSEVRKIMKFSNDVNQVKISNLHKVKGLQAPVVILARPWKQEVKDGMYADSSSNTLYFTDVTSTSDNSTTTYCKSNRYSSNVAQAQTNSKIEERRIEYVAATRAESVLIIGKPDNLAKNEFNPWGHLLTDDLQEIPDFAFKEQEPVIEQYDAVMNEYCSIVNRDCNTQSYKTVSPSELRVKVFADNEDEVVEYDKDEINKAQLGTLIHRLLECLVSSRYHLPEIKTLATRIFEEYGIIASEKLFNKVCVVGEIFVTKGFKQTSNDVPQNLFEILKNAEDVMCEVPFAYRGGDSIISGIIDLLYKDSSGWHVIDYKTNIEGDISKLEEEYKGQLDVYKKAVKQATGLDCDAHIYHIETLSF